MSNTPTTPLESSATEEVRTTLKTWLNTYEDKPVTEITFEQLPPNDVGLCFESAQSPYYVARYILGGYKAQYQFRLVYRVLPSDDSDALEAIGALTALATWAETTTPPTLENARNVKVSCTSDAAVIAAYEDGSYDYSINLTLFWEVIKKCPI